MWLTSCHRTSQRPSAVSAAAGNSAAHRELICLLCRRMTRRKRNCWFIWFLGRSIGKLRSSIPEIGSLYIFKSCKNAFTTHWIGSCCVSNTSSCVTDTSRWEMISQWLQAVDTCIQGHGQPLGWDVICAGVNPCVQILTCKLTVFKGSTDSFSCHLFNSDSFMGTWSRFSHCSVAHMPNRTLFFFNI